MRRLILEGLEDRRLLTFLPAVSYPTGGGPLAVVTADFNNDGRLDLATSHSDMETGYGTVSVLKGNGDGSFQAAHISVTGPQPFSLTAGDFNADGKLDLATGDYGDVSILLGLGDGTFADPVAFSIPEGWNTGSIATGDLNGDGKLDLVVTSDDEWFGAYVTVLIGHGDGSFADAITYDAVYGEVYSPVLADFNGDGKVDVAVAGWQMYSAIVFLGNGDGTLQEPRVFGTGAGTGANSVAAGDFNADGKLDLITTNYSSNSVSMLLGNGDGTFQTARSFAAGNAPQSATVSDVNGDGKLDLVVANSSSTLSPDATVSVLLGGGDGSLARPISTLAGGPGASSVVMADFNGDGRPDAAANTGWSSVAVLLNDGNWAVQTTPLLKIGDVALKEGAASKTTAFNFTITLSAPSTETVTVNFATANGTASAGSDYVAKSGTVTFLPGETTKTVTISVKGDKAKESNETFFVNLASANGAMIADGQGLGTILDDDSASGGGKKLTSASAVDAALNDWLSAADKKRKQ